MEVSMVFDHDELDLAVVALHSMELYCAVMELREMVQELAKHGGENDYPESWEEVHGLIDGCVLDSLRKMERGA
jgi:hypothetical protein